MSAPPPYPRTAYLADRPDDFLGVPCDVEEKLDGANVAAWLDGTQLRVMSRGGVDAMDRAGQLGRLRAWVAERDAALRDLCSDGTVAYGEWLWVRHGVPYDRLPDWFVLLDTWRRTKGFAATSERNAAASIAGLTVPPTVANGVVIASVADAQALIPQAAWGPTRAEGVVLRTEDGRRAKVVRSDFTQRSDTAWHQAPDHNCLARSSVA